MGQSGAEYGRITDAALERVRRAVGVRTPVAGWNRTVSREGIEHFALGIGDDNPLWWDDDYAAASPLAGRTAPPCYLHSHLRGPKLQPEHGRSNVSAHLPGVFALVGAETWRWRRPVRVGETLRAESTLAEVSEHQGRFGGRTIRQLERISVTSDAGDEVAELDHVIDRFERDETRARRTYLDRPLAVWSAADWARFEGQYAQEAAARRGAEPRFIEEVQSGDGLAPMLKGPLTLTNIIGFLLGIGSPNTPANRTAAQFYARDPDARLVEAGLVDTIEAPHWDAALARASGLPSGYDFARQRASWFSHLVTDWMGDAGFLTELESKITRPNLIGDVTWLAGRVVAVEPATRCVTLALSATNQLEEITAKAMARVRLPSRGGDAGP
ncbi:MAG: acyl dehydratase [Phenylobacterium sp.]|jgi:acyl dehydratase|nr:acyl dehydratase [Phenylobacterium sp.]